MNSEKFNSKLNQEQFKLKLKNYYKTNPLEFNLPEQLTPWFTPNSPTSTSIERLNKEVLDFYNYLLPSEQETRIREYFVSRIVAIIKSISHIITDVNCYGSFKNNIYLPTSDIDIVISIKPESYTDQLGLVFLKRSASILKEFGIISESKEVFGASTPILKCILNATGHQIDISFDNKSATKSCACIDKYLNFHPLVRPLVILTKHILYENQLERVYTGGLSSYSTILLAVSFCQKYASRKQTLLPNDLTQLGQIWLEFLEFYGSQFDSKSLKICVMEDGNLIPRIQSEIFDPIKLGISKENGNISYLWIIDPNNPESNVAKGTFKYTEIEALFHEIPLAIKHAISLNKAYPEQSLLDGIVGIRQETFIYRRLLKELFNIMKVKIDDVLGASDSSTSMEAVSTSVSANPVESIASVEIAKSTSEGSNTEVSLDTKVEAPEESPKDSNSDPNAEEGEIKEDGEVEEEVEEDIEAEKPSEANDKEEEAPSSTEMPTKKFKTNDEQPLTPTTAALTTNPTFAEVTGN
ncbi:Nucleotidyltransferase [Conidiobolus coronatus NRRL 28638]|uniref:polynucleotide adenylyltransferase n=1 Tax=Conidiobolus coronatus (strain ATCC 28846 / CBS 209.66 / NRRL 28638) TaxID=796925 RepID=A0A137NY17_CONC2|nr:Nucleotidyltransferase [Conidiobolus coronatus NRRL 28638]|eukprot:KXN67602.1 Nucleotidyltransferase [Conidiobolus coronatus NRRL 28638]